MNESVNKSNPHKGEIEFLDYLIVLAKHSRMIIYGSAMVTVLTWFILFLLPNKYTATTRLLPPQQNMSLSGQIIDSLGISSGPAGASGGAAGMAASMLGLKTPADLYVGMLTGDTIYDHIIKRFKLREYYSSSLIPVKKTYIEDIRKKLSKRADITAGKDGLIYIEVTDEDPKLAAEIANAFAAELDDLLQELSRKDANNYLSFLEKERDQVSKSLAKAEETLRGFSEQTSVLQIDAQTRGILEYIANLRASVDAKEVQIKVLRQQATPFNYDVLRLETELKGLKEKLHESEIQVNQNCKGEVCLPTSKLPSLGLEYLRLVREAKFQEVIYQMYSKLVELARMDAIRSVPMIQVVDQAIPAEKRSNKRLLPAMLAGFCAGFFMVFWAFVSEWKQQYEANEGQIQRLALLDEYMRPYKRGFSRLKKLIRFRKTPQ
jgi:tyrosine-protein kinase Etk/Wzc